MEIHPHIGLIFDSSIGYDTEPSLVFPTSRNQLSEEEEAEQYIIDTLQSQKEFEGMNLNQVKVYIVGLNYIYFIQCSPSVDYFISPPIF